MPRPNGKGEQRLTCVLTSFIYKSTAMNEQEAYIVNILEGFVTMLNRAGIDNLEVTDLTFTNGMLNVTTRDGVTTTLTMVQTPVV